MSEEAGAIENTSARQGTDGGPPASGKTSNELAELVTVRAATPVELERGGYIRDSWQQAALKHIHSAAYLSNHSAKVGWPIWAKLFPEFQERVLKQAAVYILTPRTDPTTILTYAIVTSAGDAPVLVWVQTKKSFWKRGLARYLLEQCGFDALKPAVIATPGPVYGAIRRKIPAWEFVPHWLFLK